MKKVLPPATEADARNRAVLAITAAVCGYMRGAGQHVCKQGYGRREDGCETVPSWAAMVRRIEDVLEGWELTVAPQATGQREDGA